VLGIKNMHHQFLQFMEQCAHSAGYELMQNCATFNLSKTPGAKGVLPGAVYGVAVVLSDSDAHALEAEAGDKGSLKTPLHRIKRLPLGGTAAIPLYWGKDAAVGYRLYRHLLDEKPKAGCLGGRFYETLTRQDLLVASVPVCDFVAFEKYMEKQYPPLLFNAKTSNLHCYVRLAV
jgi:hypothetical protein